MIDYERLDTPQPATRAESAALLVEVVNLALYGDKDPWNSGLRPDMDLPGIDKGYIGRASSRTGSATIHCKYDRSARDELNWGQPEKTHVASLVIGENTYDIFIATPEDYVPEDEDVLTKVFHLLEIYGGAADLEAARRLPFDTLAEGITIEVFEGLPMYGSLLRGLGKVGLRFAKLTEGQSTPGFIAAAEGMQNCAKSVDAARAMELSLSATTIDSQTARELTAALREDYEPVIRW